MAEQVTIKVNRELVTVPTGTVLAAALAQAGIKRFRRSVSGVARGPLCGMGLCFECRVTLNGEPNCRSCLTLCQEGMEVRTDEDGASTGSGEPPEPLASRPPSPLTPLPWGERNRAALRAPSVPDANAWAKGKEIPNVESLNCEILVIGAGPGGLAAACVAAEAGKEVIVLDNSPWVGGQIWRGGDHMRSVRRHTMTRIPRAARHWISRLRASRAHVFSNVTVFGTSKDRAILAEAQSSESGRVNNGPARILEVSWKNLIIATGAREVFLPFPGWTLPGVVGPGGLHAMAKAGWPIAGKRVVVAGTGPLLLAVAEGLQRHGSKIVLVAEQAPWSNIFRFGLGLLRFPTKLAQGIVIRAALARLPFYYGVWPIKAEGSDSVSSVTLTDGARTWEEQCDYLACGFHLVPNLELPMLLGCAIADGAVQVNELQETSVQNVLCAGESTGVGGADSALIEGQIAGYAAAGEPEAALPLFRRRASWHLFRAALSRTYALRPELKRLAAPETIVCRCEDISYKELSAFDSWRGAKLQTRCGMGPCQGRICGTATNVLFGWQFASVRPPLFPVPTAALLALGACSKSKMEANTETNHEPSTHSQIH